jgi:enamine deaminase RidA (YjgF/YER057c/UK114 family)
MTESSAVEHINVEGMHGTAAYSHAVRIGNVLICSGVVARQPDGSIFAPGDPEAQARYCYQKLGQVLNQAGCDWRDLAKITTYRAKFEHGEAINKVKREFLVQPLPASTGIVVQSLSDPGLLFEIEAIAEIPEK